MTYVPYKHSNADIIDMMRRHYRIDGDMFWMQIDRFNRTMTNTESGAGWTIPAEWDMT